jgi:two-component system, NarL family, response regulator LiaR
MTTQRLLIVDDVPQVRKDLRTLLSLAGEIEVIGEADNGFYAIHLAEALQPHVILMDLEMPGLNGFEATQKIKRNRPQCRVIALTVHAYEAARKKAAQAGIDAFIVKGAAVETIIDMIEKGEDDEH